MMTTTNILKSSDIKPIDFEATFKEMKDHGMTLPVSRITVSVKDAHTVLYKAMKFCLGKVGSEMVWIDEYEQVSDWLENSKGRGLLLFGNSGRGKSVLCRYALPAVIYKYCGKVVHCHDIQTMNAHIDEALAYPLVSLDDIGTEDESVSYGNRRMAFAEIMDNSEKTGKLVIASTNLDKEGLEKKYGIRVMDRIIGTMDRICFNGKSFRK